jgi:hypothetical protein
MTNKEVIKRVKDNINRGSTYSMFNGNRPPGKNQKKLLDKHDIPVDVDPEIRNIIIELNEKGIRTLGSCAGHAIGKWNGFVTIANTIENTDMIVLEKIFKKHGVGVLRFNTTKWVDWFSVNFKSIGKSKKDLKDEQVG